MKRGTFKKPTKEKLAELQQKKLERYKARSATKKASKVANLPSRKLSKTKRARKMGLKRKLCEQYGLPIIPCSRWGTAKAPTRTDLLRGMLWTVFSKYIRERDADKNCITCNLPLNGDIQAGHYVPVGDSSVSMWFREDNVHGEHANCNANWNDWHLVPMRKNLVKLYGEEHVDIMDSYEVRKASIDWSEEEYVSLIKKYFKAP